jgi:hypothetical protein
VDALIKHARPRRHERGFEDRQVGGVAVDSEERSLIPAVDVRLLLPTHFGHRPDEEMHRRPLRVMILTGIGRLFG